MPSLSELLALAQEPHDGPQSVAEACAPPGHIDRMAQVLGPPGEMAVWLRGGSPDLREWSRAPLERLARQVHWGEVPEADLWRVAGELALYAGMAGFGGADLPARILGLAREVVAQHGEQHRLFVAGLRPMVAAMFRAGRPWGEVFAACCDLARRRSPLPPPEMILAMMRDVKRATINPMRGIR